MIRISIVCKCTAYKFPHRLSGGKCTGQEWAGSYVDINRAECEQCNNFNNYLCEVSTGGASIKSCEGVERLNGYKNIAECYPVSFEEMYGSLLEQHNYVNGSE